MLPSGSELRCKSAYRFVRSRHMADAAGGWIPFSPPGMFAMERLGAVLYAAEGRDGAASHRKLSAMRRRTTELQGEAGGHLLSAAQRTMTNQTKPDTIANCRRPS